MKLRSFWVLLHRYIGLAMTVFLIVVGLTGSLLAFQSELDALCHPDWPTTSQEGKTLEPLVLLENVEQYDSRLQVDEVWMTGTRASVSVSPRQDPLSGQPYVLPYDKLVLDVYTGRILGGRLWGDLSQGLTNLVPFVYTLHYSLALGDFGYWLLGFTALFWTVDCFVGFYLTLPAAKRIKAENRLPAKNSFWRRWRPAWLIKWTASPIRITFDLHRAGGLWLWLALLVFAWSSVYMNLGDFYSKVMQTVSEYHQPWTEFADLPQPLDHPKISWRQAQRIGQKALSDQAVDVESPVGLWINRAKGFYVYSVRSRFDIQDHGGQTRVLIDANSGVVKQVLLPSGQYNGNTITSWLLALHTANVWGLPYRIFVSAFGLVIVSLSVTGFLIWLKKRKGKRRH